MEILFLILVVFLLALAVIDLFVGVSNDAVNFLNSAVGSRIAPLKHIFLVASIGVLIGATFSSGMMDVARHGMFFPENFSFQEMIFIFFAVMVADVLLLNLFNMLGMPTSTTVSIIFELLGAACCTTVVKLYCAGNGFGAILEYIKLDKTATIISAILASVVIAFIVGALVQFLCRVLFSFNLEKTFKYFGAVYGGFALTSILYFLVMKGAKGASFMKPEYLEFIKDNTAIIVAALFIGFTVICELMILMKKNVFKLIILGGTFALAFAFASNDLVNFVGVPLAALEGFMTYTANGNDASISMSVLNESSKASSIYLVISGLIMVVTLVVSKNARRVIQTSINLSSSVRGTHEQFGASLPGRVITRMGLGISRGTLKVMPAFMTAFSASRYTPVPRAEDQPNLPFDYVRASINLAVAAVLIASATSLKLPLSTTYVTFMVAMGTSFADGAWDRESAVYRISGVFAVVTGWFLTGLCAFVTTFLISLLIAVGSWIAVFALMLIACAVIIKTNFVKSKQSSVIKNIISSGSEAQAIIGAVRTSIPKYFDHSVDAMEECLDSFFADNELKLRHARNKISNVLDDVRSERAAYYSMALDLKDKKAEEALNFFYLSYSNMVEACKSEGSAISDGLNHVANRHVIFGGRLKSRLYEVLNSLKSMAESLDKAYDITSSTQGSMSEVLRLSIAFNDSVERAQQDLVNEISDEELSMSSSETCLSLLQGMRDIANRYVSIAMYVHAMPLLNKEAADASVIEKFKAGLTAAGTSPKAVQAQFERLELHI